ncbi:MAG TPA: ABC transporter ATP-binding protein [Pyrinomonadaceae bacterium]|jgi:ABC-type polysaccharide/polyol phosphate transport system ATPase subunit|nr:ABC transporter ATP-binding protein [Pyrinomonadaceae bacterium]
MTTALRVEGVAKQYRIYEHPSDRLVESLTRGRVRRHREFWALRDVSFEVERGTTTGIVGPNGSGKSTLLQIVTGTLEPTHGRVLVEGRVAALLELGAGFNPEFTGLENVYMNAALMGFSRRETDGRLKEIERFAEIGDFLHQPVKTYSSGMYVRLAFAIAVNTDPDVLVVDEALSVGDTIFQHRCVRRIREMQEAGTTILFVSHEPTLVRALCSRAIFLNAGRMLADGQPVDVLNRYQRLIMAREEAYDGESASDAGAPAADAGAAADAGDESAADRTSAAAGRAPLTYTYRHGNRDAEIVSAEIINARGEPVELVDSGDAVVVRMRILFHRDVERPVCGFMIRNRHGINVYGTNTEQRGLALGAARAGEQIEAEFAFDCWLGQEHYFVSVAAHSPEGVAFDWMDGVIFFRVACPVEMEGLANLNARASARRAGGAAETERGGAGGVRVGAA